MKGYVEHVEEYRSYWELKTQVEQMKKNLLVQDIPPCNDARFASKPALETCDTAAITQGAKGNLLTKEASEVGTKTPHDPSIELSDREYVDHVKRENPGVIVIDLKPITENSTEKYNPHQKSGPIEQVEILEENNMEKQDELHVKEHTINVVKKDGKADLAPELSPCTKCTKTFTTKSNLRSHMQSCHNIGDYCPKCGTFFNSRKYMKRHLREVHIGFTFKCGKCHYRFKGKSSLDRHISVCKIHEVKGINNMRISRQCPICPEEFNSKSSLKEHVWTIHQVPNAGITTKPSRSFIFTCEVCASIYRSKGGLVIHLMAHHDGEKELLVCGFQGCTFRCISKKVLNKHKLVCHKGDRPFSCVKCYKPFAKNKDMLQHRARMHRDLAFKCPGVDGSSGCGKDFKRKEDIKRHMKVCGNPPDKSWDKLSKTQKIRRARAELELSKRDKSLNWINI